MPRSSHAIFLLLLLACQPSNEQELNDEVLYSLGNKFKTEYAQAAENFRTLIVEDSANIDALMGLAETNIILYIFGFTSREETIPEAEIAFQKAQHIDSMNSNIHKLAGKLSMLNWNWDAASESFQKSIQADPQNLDARHWYSLWLIAMKQPDKAMAQSDTIMTMDPDGNYLIGRGSLIYFQHEFEELKQLMLEAVAKDPNVPWGYDWLGMAYNGLEEHDDAIDTYFTAFELSDGTVEVGAGLGHALGLAGKTEMAKRMANYYAQAAQSNYLPQVQRAFIHLGIDEYDEAIRLLEEAFEAKSWFLIFAQIEPWLDPLRNDDRFNDILRRMEFPD